jgi:hypothetical protein
MPAKAASRSNKDKPITNELATAVAVLAEAPVLGAGHLHRKASFQKNHC